LLLTSHLFPADHVLVEREWLRWALKMRQDKGKQDTAAVNLDNSVDESALFEADQHHPTEDDDLDKDLFGDLKPFSLQSAAVSDRTRGKLNQIDTRMIC
jgi:hypothetical protein